MTITFPYDTPYVTNEELHVAITPSKLNNLPHNQKVSLLARIMASVMDLLPEDHSDYTIAMGIALVHIRDVAAIILELIDEMGGEMTTHLLNEMMRDTFGEKANEIKELIDEILP